MWLLAHDKVLTNYARWRRMIADNPECVICNNQKEDSLHAIRNCNEFNKVWMHLLPPSQRQIFLSSIKRLISLKFNKQVCHKHWWRFECQIYDSSWGYGSGGMKEFSKIYLYQLRETQTFGGVFCGNVGSLEENIDELRHTWPFKHEALIGWKKPTSSVIKINTDGAVKGNPSFAGVGCMLRDHHGQQIIGAVCNLEITTSVNAELWGVSGFATDLGEGI